MPVEVRPAAPADLLAIQRVQVRAGRLFAEIDDPVVAACADHPPFPVDALADWAAAGRAWVATVGGEVAGFAVADVLDGCHHIEEIAVDPVHGRQGIGRALVEAVVAHAGWQRRRAVTLTTFRDVPWNGPWYRRIGFRELAEDEIGPELRARREDEARGGLVPELRVCLRRLVE